MWILLIILCILSILCQRRENNFLLCRRAVCIDWIRNIVYTFYMCRAFFTSSMPSAYRFHISATKKRYAKMSEKAKCCVNNNNNNNNTSKWTQCDGQLAIQKKRIFFFIMHMNEYAQVNKIYMCAVVFVLCCLYKHSLLIIIIMDAIGWQKEKALSGNFHKIKIKNTIK